MEILEDFYQSRQTKPIHSRKHYTKAPVRGNAIAMNTNSTFTGTYT